MDFTGWTSSEEGEDCEVSQKGDGYSFFGMQRGIIHIDYLPSKQTINGDYYAGLLDCFNNIFKEKMSPFGEEESALPSRQCTGCHVPSTDGQIQRIPLQIASLSSIFARFSPLRLNPFLFPNLKKWFAGKRFTTREQLIAETEAYFEGLDKSYYSDGLKKLENRWIELKGDYVKK